MPEEPRQYWVRNDKGKTWGPLTYASIELLVANRLLLGRLQASRDGINFAFPGRFPDLRDAFPKELWGDSTEPLPGDPVAAQSGPPVVGARGRTPSEASTAPPVRPSAGAAPSAARQAPGAQRASALHATSADGLPDSGELSSYSPFSLYYLVATGNETGKLSLQSPQVTYELFFRKGAPEAALSSRPEEDLGAFLVEQGVLNPEQLADARKVAPGFGGSILNALFGMQLLSPGDAFKHISGHAMELIVAALQLGEGSFAFERDAQMPASAMPLGDRWAVACKAVRGLPVERVREWLGVRMEMPVMKTGGRVELEKLRLNAHEARFTASFDGVHTLEELCESAGAEHETLLRTAYLLVCFKVLSFSEDVRRSKPKAAASAVPPAVHHAATPPPVGPSKVGPPASTPPRVAAAGTAAKGDDPGALRALLESLKGKNHFQTLEVPETATTAQIKTAFFKLAKVHHPDTLPAGAPAEVGKLKADLFAAISEAYRVLADDKLRASYLEDLKAGSPEAVDAARIFAAEESFQKGCILVKARKYQEAVEMLGEAVKLNDKEGEFYAWRGWACFLAAKDKSAAKSGALRDLETAIKLNPKCAQSYYFVGQISRLCGDAAGALKWFKKTLTVDANHIDAQREVRLAATQKAK